MILVVGATGLLGKDICHRLRQRGRPVRALARPGANPERLEPLRASGVELAMGDLKDAESLRSACRNATAVLSTASSTATQQSGDSIETVDLQGQLSLIRAAKEAGVQHFTFVSIPPNMKYESPLTRAKSRVEAELAASGVPYTVLQANYFMEVWLSPYLGFDYPKRKVTIFGDGRNPIGLVSYRDVGEFAARAPETDGARNRSLTISGPEDLRPLDMVRTFEEVTGAAFERQHVPMDALLTQLEAAADPMAETYLKLQLDYASGCVMDTSEALRLMPIRQKTVREYAQEVTGSA
jgi:uncharacterized protein YbjT (DUF2867 family)